MGHFPDLPIMPGVLQLEAMAQLAALSYFRDGDPDRDFMIASMTDCRFRRKVVPGDQLRIVAEILKDRVSMVQVGTQCFIGDDLVAEATILAHVALPKSEPGKSMKIHPSAVIDKQVELGKDVEVGPFSIIRGKVRIGDGTRILSHAVIGIRPWHRRDRQRQCHFFWRHGWRPAAGFDLQE